MQGGESSNQGGVERRSMDVERSYAFSGLSIVLELNA